MTMFYILVIYLLTGVQVTTGVSTNEGKEFLVSTPSMMSTPDSNSEYPKLLLIIRSLWVTTVRIKSQHVESRDDYVDDTFRLEAMVTRHYSKPALVYGPDTSVGYRWTYHIVGSQLLTLLVVMETSPTSSETFTPVPVAGWGKEYYVVTLESQASVVFISNENKNTLTFTLSSKVDNLTITLSDATLQDGYSANVLLLPYQSYSISTCGKPEAKGSITGSKVTGEHPFGVISGNCMSVNNFKSCVSYADTEESANSVVEMFLPLKTYGKLFILFKTTGRSTPGHYLIMAQGKKAQVLMFDNFKAASEQMEKFQINPGEWELKESNYKWLLSSSALQVVYIQSSSCVQVGGRDGAPSMVVVVPVELFYHLYIAMIPPTEMKHYVLFVAPVALVHTIKSIYLNSTPDNSIVSQVTGDHAPLIMYPPFQAWQVYEFEARKNATMTLFSTKTRFGCYVHGQSETSTYMHSAGFISSNINDKECVQSVSTMTEGDLLDNDCDGFVDEEMKDGTDDDTQSTDSMSDEDLAFPFGDSSTIDDFLRYHTTDFLEGSIDFPQDNAPASPNETGDTFTFPLQPVTDAPAPITFGTLTEWGEWRCTRQCSVKDLIRKRDCIPTADNRGCDGALVEYKHSSCHVNKCPEGCPPQYFGEDCKHKCIQCTTDCDKFYGTCPACFPGYDYPESGCLLDRREYKDWTRWECSENCNNPYLVRKRVCKEGVAHEGNKTCMQPIIDVKPGLCHVGKKCFKHCPQYKWGDNCSNSCENCEQPCNKLNGVCESCDAGYQRPENGCQMPCKHYFYGLNCSGSCIDKCGEDCIERVYGECRPSSINNTVLMFAILIVPVAIFVYFVIKRKKEEEELAAAKSMISLKSGASKSKQSLLSQSRSQQSLKSSRSKGSLHGGAKMKSKSQTSLKVTPSVEV